MCMMSLTTAFMEECAASSGKIMKHYCTRRYTQYVSVKSLSIIPLSLSSSISYFFLLFSFNIKYISKEYIVCIIICSSTAPHISNI